MKHWEKVDCLVVVLLVLLIPDHLLALPGLIVLAAGYELVAIFRAVAICQSIEETTHEGPITRPPP